MHSTLRMLQMALLPLSQRHSHHIRSRIGRLCIHSLCSRGNHRIRGSLRIPGSRRIHGSHRIRAGLAARRY
jgi:hypothetical protein